MPRLRCVGDERVLSDDLAGVEVAHALFADGHYGAVVIVAEDQTDALVCDQFVHQTREGCLQLAEFDLAREEVEIDLGGVAAAIGGDGRGGGVGDDV